MPSIYTAQQIVTELVLRLGNRTDLGPTVPSGSGRIANFLNTAQLLLATSPMAMETLDVSGATLATVAGTAVYNLTAAPTSLTDILGIMSMRNNTSGNRLRKFPWQEFRSLNQQASGPPLRWARWGNFVAFDPQPDAVNTILIDYRREPALGVIEVPNRYQETLLDMAEFIGWKALQQFDKSQVVYRAMPAITQFIVQNPMDRDQFEAQWDQDLAIRPIGFDALNTMHP